MTGIDTHRAVGRAGRLTVTMALVAGTVVLGTALTPASPAAAATIDIGDISAQVSNHVGTASDYTTPAGSNNCIRYSPAAPGNPPTSSTSVDAPDEARTAHGYPSTGSCPTNLSTSTQSAVGVRPGPSTDVDDGDVFLLGRVIHYNNPISGSTAQYYTGDLSLQLGDFEAGASDVTFQWRLWETPNDTYGSDCPPGRTAAGCRDRIEFSAVGSQTALVKDGIEFQLVIQGFQRLADGSTDCPETPTGTAETTFDTDERATTHACIYATLTQARDLIIEKATVGNGVTPPATTFGFDSTSNQAGSPWQTVGATPDFSVSPTSTAPAALAGRRIARGETVTVTELPHGDEWALTDISCTEQDATGMTVPLSSASSVTVDAATGRLSLVDVGPPLNSADPDVTCRFTNTYTPMAHLTLVKEVVNTGGGTATATEWTLSATGAATAPTAGTIVQGTTGTANVTSVRVPAGQYDLSESSPTTGYVPGGWTCTGASALSGTTVTIASGQDVTCRIVNTYATGTFRIAKHVDDPRGGYTGGSARAFTGTYDCGGGAQPFSVSTGTPFQVTVPAGASCTATETLPATAAGDFLNASYAWGAPSYSARPVTVAGGQTATITITNPVVQHTGTFAVAKQVQGDGGYVAGSGRTFPLAYTCTLTNGPTATGTLHISTAGAVGPAAPIPTGSTCTFTETLETAAGDFAGDDPSYSWSGYDVAPPSITIGDGTSTTVTVTNTYTRSFGSLTLSKQVSGDGYVGSGAAFTVAYDCGNGLTGTVDLADGQTATVTDIPAGSVCHATETTPAEDLLDAAHDWGTPAYTTGIGVTGNAVTVVADDTVGVTVTNPTVAVFGTVAVTKSFTGATSGLASGATFTAAVDCGNAFAGALTLSAAGAWTASTPALAVGTQCTITEVTPTGGLVDASYAWGPTPAAQAVTIGASGQTVAVTLTNDITRVYGTIQIAKTVVDPDGVVDPGRTFTGTWACTYGNDSAVSGTFDLAASTATTPAQVLLGSTCTVAEDAATLTASPSATDPSYFWQAAVYAPAATVQVSATSPGPVVTITNTVARRTGTFSVAKVVTGDGKADGYSPTNGQFPFAASCTAPGGFDTGTLSFGLDDGAAWSGPADIPAGATCTITEGAWPATNGPSYTWDSVSFAVAGATGTPGTPSTRSVQFTVPEGGSVDVTATNVITRKFGEITVTKTLLDPDGGYTSASAFAVTLDCGDAGTYQLGVPAAGSTTQDGIPWGTACTASETAPGASSLRDASFAWGDVSYSPTDATATVGATQQTITVTNEIVRVHGPVDLTKVVVAPDGIVDPQQEYTGTWTCRYGSDTPVTGTWSASAGQTVRLRDDVLLTSTCTATEDDPAGPSSDPSYRWVLPAGITAVNAVTAASPNVIAVTNTVARDTGAITVTKAVTGATAGYVGTGDAFTVRYRCGDGLGGITPINDSVAIGDGGTATISGVPFGWTCTFSEDAPGTGLLADGSYTWAAPVVAPSSVELTSNVPNASVEIENPITRVHGTLHVVKVVTDPSNVVTTDATFGGAYTCQYGTDPAVTGTWTVSGADGGVFAATDDLLVGSTCAVTEDAPDAGDLVDGSWGWAPAVIGDDVTITANATATVTVTNEPVRLYGGLTITKTIDDLTGVVPDTTFRAVWACTQGAQTWTDSVVVGVNSSAVAFAPADELVPATASCTVTEDTPVPTQLVDGSYAWANPAYSATAVTVPDAQSADVTITNSTVRVYGGVEVVKVVTGAAAPLVDADRAFTGTITCQYGTDPATAPLPWSATTSTPATVTGVLVGSVCTAVEDDATTVAPPVPGDESFAWGAASVDGPTTVQPATAAEPARITVTNPTTREFGAFTITKTADPASGTTVDVGQVVTYTLRVDSLGDVPVHDVVLTDDLSEVLDHASFGTVQAGHLGTVARTGTTLTWTVGDLAPGASATLSYTVAVTSGGAGVTLRNAVTGTADIPPTTCAPGDPCSTEHPTRVVVVNPPTSVVPSQPTPPPAVQPPVVVTPDQLPRTGSNTVTVLRWGALVTLLGVALVLIRTRRRHAGG